MTHRPSLRQIRKACAQEGHHWAKWDRWTDYCWQCGLRLPHSDERVADR